MWQSLPKPFFALAPMADVTDVAFRTMFAKYGPPQVYWTEFVSIDGLLSPGREVLLRDLAYEENQRPIVAQLFTSSPSNMYEGAKLAKELGFDGVDINMGCPDKSIEKQGSGASLIKTPDIAVALIESAKKIDIPVSVKTRIGYSSFDREWFSTLLSTGLSALTVHLRTRQELSDVSANWECMKEITSLRDAISPDTLIIGNGDVFSLDLARKRSQLCDGVMVGRGAFGNPWFFSGKEVSFREKLEVMVEHTLLFEKLLGDIKSFHIMKKHYKAYVQGFDGAKELRVLLMECSSGKEVSDIVKRFLV